MKKNLFLAGLMMTAICLSQSSCSDNTMENAIEEEVKSEAKTRSITLVDANGTPITNVSGQCGTYYLDVKCEGEWNLSSPDGFIAMPITKGKGDARVPVIIGTNWQGARNGGISFTAAKATTRAEGESTAASDTTVTVTQNAEFDPEEVAKFISSNKGAGYSYQPYENYCLGTHIQLFNIGNLKTIGEEKGINLIVDESLPNVLQEVQSADSKEDLANNLSVAASVSLNFSAFTADVKGAYGSSETSSKNRSYAVKRMKSVLYTREVNYLNIIALADSSAEMRKKLFAPGFIKLLDEYQSRVLAEDADTDAICKALVDEMGPCFVSKSVMGCVLDYYISIDRSELSDSITITGALDIAFKESVKITGEGGYGSHEGFESKSMEASLNIRGGQTNLVSILTTGGQLKDTELLAWQQSVEPKKAVMIDMKLVPIYTLIPNYEAKQILKAYLEKVGSPVPPENEENNK